MKTLKHYLYILFLLFMGNSFSQMNPEAKTLNKPLQTSSVSTPIRPKLDTVEKDLTDGRRDNPTLYHKSISRSAGLDSNTRLVYFLHGLGGTQVSWQGSYDGLTSKYQYQPYRPFYNTGSYTNQRDFKNATYEAHKSLGDYRDVYLRDVVNADTVYKNLPPYVIGHSQGGLVARDMDMKHDTNDIIDGRINYTNERFWGIITFGTPHAGSYFAVRQDQLSILAKDLIKVMGNRELKTGAGQFQVNNPLIGTYIVTPAVNSAIQFWNDFSDNTILSIINMVGKDNSDSITRQYGPNSKYLLDTLNQFINPNMPKGLFYGVEEDALIWRLTHYTAGRDPGLYDPFTANDDSKLMDSMEQLRIQYKTKGSVSRGHARFHRAQRRSYSWFFTMRKEIIAKGYDQIASGNENAANFLAKVNLLYKVVLGSVDESNLYKIDTVKWNCKKRIKYRSTWCPAQFTTGGWCESNWSTSFSINSPSDCPNDTTWSYVSMGYNFEETHTYEAIPVIRKTLIETPSDGVVLKPSQMAFPGCLDIHKRELNERVNASGNIVPVGKSKVNHMQMRNCEETKAAMMRIYNGDGSMPIFFKLESK